MPSSPASHPGTDISEPHQGDPIPPRRSTRPRLQRSPCPGRRGTDEITKTPSPKNHIHFPTHIYLPYAHPPLISPTQRRNQAPVPRCHCLLVGPLMAGSCRQKKRQVDKYTSKLWTWHRGILPAIQVILLKTRALASVRHTPSPSTHHS